jgi:hypothetical protein
MEGRPVAHLGVATLASKSKLSALSLDAALEIERLERRQEADLNVLRSFFDCLTTEVDGGESSSLRLTEDPLRVQLLRSTIDRIEKPVSDISDLSARLEQLMASFEAISTGHKQEGLALLKRFCLSLHQTFLNEISPFHHSEEWDAPILEERFA